MEISKNGIRQIEYYEGFRARAYYCSAGVCTIGYGTTVYSNGKTVRKSDTITKEKAEKELYTYLKKNVYPKLKEYTFLTQAQYDAMCSFLYNVGSFGETLKDAMKRKNIKDIYITINKYCKVNGKENTGLKIRRNGESDAFASKKRIADLQAMINIQSKRMLLVEDGIYGTRTITATPTLRKGSKGAVVTLIQIWLGIKCDGIFGSDTKNAVMEYQKDNGLTNDGIIGKNTWKSLLGL